MGHFKSKPRISALLPYGPLRTVLAATPHASAELRKCPGVSATFPHAGEVRRFCAEGPTDAAVGGLEPSLDGTEKRKDESKDEHPPRAWDRHPVFQRERPTVR